jgi:hypothetical protein
MAIKQDLQEIKARIETVNTLGRSNLLEKGIKLPEGTSTYEIMQSIADVSSGAKSYADAIYEYYNIDKVAYPYLAVAILDTGKTRLIWSKEPLVLAESRAYYHKTADKTYGLVGETEASVVFGWLKGAISQGGTGSQANWHLTDGTWFANYPIEETDTIKCYLL